MQHVNPIIHFLLRRTVIATECRAGTARGWVEGASERVACKKGQQPREKEKLQRLEQLLRFVVGFAVVGQLGRYLQTALQPRASLVLAAHEDERVAKVEGVLCVKAGINCERRRGWVACW